MTSNQHEVACSTCGNMVPTQVAERAHEFPYWKQPGGGCPACVQQHLLRTLLERGEPAFHMSVQAAWPLDAEAVFGVLPTRLRMHADPRYSGRGVTLALLDSGFYPHADLVKPHNRIRAWVDATRDPMKALEFAASDTPAWPGWDAAADSQWHGTMTSVAAAGNGHLSHGIYSGMAAGADVVLIQVRGADGHISSESICRGLRWLEKNATRLGVRVVSMSVSGDPVEQLAGNPVDEAVATLVEQGVVVVAAAGNDGVRRLIPPATAPRALTVGGIDDHNEFERDEVELWHSNYGEASNGVPKPELVAPSIWVAAPILPGTAAATEAVDLLLRYRVGDTTAEVEVHARKLITPHYQHVDGTSFAAPLVASAVACMLEANPALTPPLVRDILRETAHPVAGASPERQGAGVLDAGRAVARALTDKHGGGVKLGVTVSAAGVAFVLHDHHAQSVQVAGSWNQWQRPFLEAARGEHGFWQTAVALPAGRHEYKFVLDGGQWLDDPANSHKVHDSLGGFNSVVEVGAGGA
jgi:serine protease AprX